MKSLNDLYDKCLELGIAESQRDFSESLLGMDRSYFSSMTSRRREPTISSLVRFYLRLGGVISATRDELVNTGDQPYATSLEGGLEELAAMRKIVWLRIEELAG